MSKEEVDRAIRDGAPCIISADGLHVLKVFDEEYKKRAIENGWSGQLTRAKTDDWIAAVVDQALRSGGSRVAIIQAVEFLVDAILEDCACNPEPEWIRSLKP